MPPSQSQRCPGRATCSVRALSGRCDYAVTASQNSIPWPDISAGQKTFVEVRQCSGEALLLDDRARERREFILDLASRALLLRFRLSGELYTHLIAAQPCDSIDECIGIAVTAVVPIVPPPSTNLVVHEERAKTLLARKEHRGDGTPLEGEWGHV